MAVKPFFVGVNKIKKQKTEKLCFLLSYNCVVVHPENFFVIFGEYPSKNIFNNLAKPSRVYTRKVGIIQRKNSHEGSRNAGKSRTKLIEIMFGNITQFAAE